MGHLRRRSVDVGGLALALGEEGRGHGWGGWEETEKGETKYAEVLIDVRAHTDNAVSLEPSHLSPCIHIEDDTRSRLIESLGSWHFEPHKLPEEEVLACAYILFEVIFRIEGMAEEIAVPLTQLAQFLQHLRNMYRQGNTYHNFQHALDVLQATYFFLYSAGTVPPVSILRTDSQLWKPDKRAFPGSVMSCLNSADIFALFMAAIGHDVGHPGLTNAFLKNAKSPLAIMYDDKSVLEQMHHALLVSLMRHHGLGPLLDRPEFGQSFRHVLLSIVLATDMGVHTDFMTKFERHFSDRGANPDMLKRRVLICQALIKCADISNPSRPYNVSKHWADALESEWTSQLLLEDHLHLPKSVKPSSDPLSQARGQVFFTKTFAFPLFQLTSTAIPQMRPFVVQCQQNLSTWEGRCSRLSANENSTHYAPPEPYASISPSQLPEDFLTAFPPTLPRSFLAAYETSAASFDLASEFFTGSSGSQSDSRPSSSGSESYSQYETCPSTSPSPPSPIRADPSAAAQPHLEITTSPAPSIGRPPSITSASSFINPQDATNSIRAAYSLGVRKRKSFHRTSWNPTPAEFQEMTGRPLRTQSPLSPSNFGSPLSPPSASTTASSSGPLTPAFLPTPGQSSLSVCPSVPSC